MIVNYLHVPLQSLQHRPESQRIRPPFLQSVQSPVYLLPRIEEPQSAPALGAARPRRRDAHAIGIDQGPTLYRRAASTLVVGDESHRYAGTFVIDVGEICHGGAFRRIRPSVYAAHFTQMAAVVLAGAPVRQLVVLMG